MENKSVQDKLIRNSVFNSIAYVWGIIVTLALTPYIIRRIGIERYGVWAILGVLTGYFGMLDFGIGSSFMKYIPEFYAKRQFNKINQIINNGFIFYLLFSFLIMALSFLFMNPIITLLGIPENLYNEAVFVFFLGIALFCISNLMNIFASIQVGLQRMDIAYTIGIVLSVPTIIGTIFFLERGYGLRGLMINAGVILFINLLLNVIAAFKILPELKFNPFSFSKEMFRASFLYGVKVQVVRFERIFTFQTDKLLISHFLSVGLVGFYQLGSAIIEKARYLPHLLTASILPAASELDAVGDKKRIRNLYFRGTKYIAIIFIPMLLLIFIAAPLIMSAWMGEGYGKSTLVIRILAPCYLASILTSVAATIAMGIRKLEFNMRASMLQLALNVILSIVFVIKFGFVGVIAATLISLSLSSIWFMRMFHNYMGYSFSELISKVLAAPFAVSFFAGLALFGLRRIINLFAIPEGRFYSFVLLVLDSALFTVIYVLIIVKIKYIDEYDRSLIREKLNIRNIMK